jgi:membrane fusion protein, copper/silver efflux system
MKTVTGIVMAMVVGAATAQASEATKAVVASYLQIHAALSTDKIEGVKPAAAAIAKEAEGMGASGEALGKAAEAMESAADVEAARTALGPLSDAVIAAATADGWKDVSGVKVGYCPMVKQYWIQKDGTVSNPYYGSAMLTCGELKDPGK